MAAKLKAGAKLHFVGIGGIGMSGLAQLYASMGYRVTGSDRGADLPENSTLFAALQKQDITIFPQDGSFVSAGLPDVLVYSSAIEDDNPDFKAGMGLPRLHRSEALHQALAAMRGRITIAIAGSCGKTTVTGWLAETLVILGADPSCLNGGLINRFKDTGNPGNFRAGSGKHFIFEADESDRSLLSYSPDYAAILNIGTDHYSRDELCRLFAAFASKVKRGLVIDESVFREIAKTLPPELEVVRVADAPKSSAQWKMTGYQAGAAGVTATINGTAVKLPSPGRHHGLNAAFVLAVTSMLGYPLHELIATAEKFHGVWRRFTRAGTTGSGIPVYDDYAHNPEKIVSCLQAAQEIASGKILAVFQPHGFGPLGFMRGALFDELEHVLRPDDIFAFLPPYYAGGSSCFTPTSEEVVAGYRQRGTKNYHFFRQRAEAESFLHEHATAGDLILVMGARDNSLSLWASAIANLTATSGDSEVV